MIAFGYVYSYTVFETQTKDYQIQNDKNIIKIERRLDKLEDRTEINIRMEEKLRHIEEKLDVLIRNGKK